MGDRCQIRHFRLYDTLHGLCHWENAYFMCVLGEIKNSSASKLQLLIRFRSQTLWECVKSLEGGIFEVSPSALLWLHWPNILAILSCHYSEVYLWLQSLLLPKYMYAIKRRRHTLEPLMSWEIYFLELVKLDVHHVTSADFFQRKKLDYLINRCVFMQIKSIKDSVYETKGVKKDLFSSMIP